MAKLPVLLLAYNRPDFTSQVMSLLRDYAPDRLYVACDGPKANKKGDHELVDTVREILTHPAWNTQVTARFLSTNAGLRTAVGHAIDWFFDNEPEGIILEDDCMPSEDFFRFSEYILDRYREDPRVWGVTGANNAGALFPPGASYGFIQFPIVWGWASWANRWAKNDPHLTTYPPSRSQLGLGGWPSQAHQFAFQRHFDSMLKTGTPDSWAYPWTWSTMSQGGLWAVPSAHLVQNIGFRDDSTHVTSPRLKGGPIEPLGKIVPCQAISVHTEAEVALLKKLHFLVTPLWVNRPINFLKVLKRRFMTHLIKLRTSIDAKGNN